MASTVDTRAPGFLYFERGLHAGARITVRGWMLPSVQRLEINLKVGVQCGEDIALHFNPRVDQGTVVLTTFQCGAWQIEERHGPVCPFTNGQEFTVCIEVHCSEYVISVNGCEFAKFAHRIHPSKVRYLQMCGVTECSEARITNNC